MLLCLQNTINSYFDYIELSAIHDVIWITGL